MLGSLVSDLKICVVDSGVRWISGFLGFLCGILVVVVFYFLVITGPDQVCGC